MQAELVLAVGGRPGFLSRAPASPRESDTRGSKEGSHIPHDLAPEVTLLFGQHLTACTGGGGGTPHGNENRKSYIRGPVVGLATMQATPNLNLKGRVEIGRMKVV